MRVTCTSRRTMGNGRLVAVDGSVWFCVWLMVVCCAVRPARISHPQVPIQPQPCQAPQQWEGRAVVYDHGTGRNSRVLMSYDGQNQRIRILDEKKGHIPCKKFYEYIYLFKNPVLFKIEQVTKQCSKLPLLQPWDPYDIPDNSTYEDHYSIGGPGDQIEVQEWSDRKPARKFETWVGVYTVKDCYPVQETYTKSYNVTSSTRFFDLQLGIRDPSVFIPPSTCQAASSEEMSNDC